jgi:hypothetical protein
MEQLGSLKRQGRGRGFWHLTSGKMAAMNEKITPKAKRKICINNTRCG